MSEFLGEWVSEFLGEWVIVVYHQLCNFSAIENKLIFNEMMMKSALYWTNTLSWNFIVLAHWHWNNSPLIDMSTHSDTLSCKPPHWLNLSISNRIGGVMVTVLTSSAVDRGFIGGVMVTVLTSSAVDRGFKPWSGKTKDYIIGIW
jgi:hypothetical protein